MLEISNIFFLKDLLPPLGFKTYFVRMGFNESAIKGAETITLTPAKKIVHNIKEDIPIENEVIIN